MRCRVAVGVAIACHLTDTVRDIANVGCDWVGVVVINVLGTGISPVCWEVVHGFPVLDAGAVRRGMLLLMLSLLSCRGVA